MVPMRRVQGLPHAEHSWFQPAPTDPLLAKAGDISQAGEREEGGSMRNIPADTKVREQGGGGGTSDA